MQKQGPGGAVFGNGSMLAAQLQQQLLGMTLSGHGRAGPGSLGGSPELSSADMASPLNPLLDGGYPDGGMLPSGLLQQQAGALGGGSGASIYIKGMPEDADKLWLFEKFAR